jgi:hypothetical protein
VIGLLAGVLVNSGLFNADWSRMYSELNGTSIPQLGFAALMVLYLVFFMIAYLANMGIFTGLLAGLPLIVLIVVGIAVFFIFFKIGWMLIKTFVSILLLIAAGPFMILFGAMGGGGVGAWLKNLISLLAVFPTVGLFFALAFFFLAAAMPNIPVIGDFITSNIMPFEPTPNAIIGSSTWVPPFTPAPGGEMNFVWLFMSYSLLSLAAKSAEMIKGALAGRPISYGSAIGAPAAGAIGIVGAPFGFVGETLNLGQKAVAESTYSKLNAVFNKIAGRTGR